MLQQMISFLVDTAAAFFVYLLLARFHFQWLGVPFRSQVGEFVIVATNWIVRPARRVIPPLAGFDLATVVAAWLLQALALYLQFALRGGDLGSAPGAALALLAAGALIDLVRLSGYLLVFAVILQAILSWVAPHAASNPVLDAVTRPFLRPAPQGLERGERLRRVEHAVLAQPRRAPRPLRRVERRIQERRADPDFAHRVDLILHERNQGRHD